MLEPTDIREYGIPFIEKISLIHKIREVQARVGFTRITPADKDPDTRLPSNLVSIVSRCLSYLS